MVGKNVRLENIPCAWVQYKSQGSDIYFVHSFWFLAECSANRGHLSWQQSFRQIGVWEKKSLLNCGITVAQALTTSICQSHCWSQRRATQWCRGSWQREERKSTTGKVMEPGSGWGRKRKVEQRRCVWEHEWGRCTRRCTERLFLHLTLKALCTPRHEMVHFSTKTKGCTAMRRNVLFSQRPHSSPRINERLEFQAFLLSISPWCLQGEGCITIK